MPHAIELKEIGSLFLTRPMIFDYVDDPPELSSAAGELFDMVKSKRIHINIRQRHALRDAALAHAALESRQTAGATIAAARGVIDVPRETLSKS